MRLHVLSDLHLEHEPFVLPQVEADAVVLAGDIAPGTAGVEWAKRALDPGRPVVYVAGNHEFYGHEFPALIDDLRAAAAGTNVHVLERDELTIDGIRFLGCLLWTDFGTAGADRQAQTMRFSERVVNDYRLIRSSDTGDPLRAAQTLADHNRSREWLTQRLSGESTHATPGSTPQTAANRTVVVTHHLPRATRPTDNLVLQALAGSILSDLTELIDEAQPALWIHGHSHRQADSRSGATRILANPRGSPREPNPEFDPRLVVEI